VAKRTLIADNHE
jgi:chemotaxis response regulator CheB